MRIIRLSVALGIILAAFSMNVQAQHDNAASVDPFIGSGGHGHVFVGANVPFGAVQLGPMNIFKGWDWCSGYHYSDSIIIGFSHTHLSGTGCADLGDVSFMPYSGTLRTATGRQDNIQGAASSYYDHEHEQAAPGYYQVDLKNGVKVELTATDRVGMHHYQYTAAGTPRVLIDLANGIDSKTYESYVQRVDDYTVQGYRFVHGWAPTHKVFFYAKFSKPVKSLDTFLGDDRIGHDELQGRNVKSVASFADDVKDVLVKVAISSVSCTNAKMNMEQELAGWDFAATHKAAADKWNRQLGVVDIQGASESERKVFYTALYHMFIAPTQYCDANGDFRGMDDKIYTNNKFRNYTTFSLWDTYRTLHPLFTVLVADKIDDMMNSMLSIYDQNGKLPIWPLLSGETNCMPGYSSVPVLADAYLKGFRGFDATKAVNAMIATGTYDKQNGVPEFMRYGYIPADKKREATSINLEYAADDRGTALMAKRMGRTEDYQTFLKRSNSYQLLFDTKINKIHPKMADGSWYEPYNPFLANHRDGIGDFTEGNGWQYTFMVPQDPEGLIACHGGDAAFVKNLDSLFVAEGDLGEGAPPDVSGMVGQYAQGNEPNHHIPYLYAYAGAQYKTAACVRALQKQFYVAQPDGYAGNEDCGQMSAWYVSSALGLYQVNPSNGVYVFGSPSFARATVNLPGGKKFTVVAHNNSDRNVYIQSARLNGRKYTRSYVTYQDIMRGGTLEFVMGPEPNRHFGAAKKDRPVSAR